MIFVRYLPWKVWALPTPIFTFLVVAVPTPFILVVEGIKRIFRTILHRRCKQLLKQHQAIILYTNRPDSQDVLEQTVFPALDVCAVAVEQYHIRDKRFRCLRVLMPRRLGCAFPLLIYLRDGELKLRSVHTAVYKSPMCVNDAATITRQLQERIADAVAEK